MQVSDAPPERIRAVRSDHAPATNWAARRKRTNRERPFVAWDGEGYTVNGKHHYALFGNSLGARVTKPSLTWRDCITLLMESPKEANHVIFAGTYDVVMMFRDTPVIKSMLEGKAVIINGYKITFRRGKFLKVIDMRAKQTRILYDVFTFFRSSFVASCREYGVGSDDLLAAVESMKSKRAGFTGIDDEIAVYMGRELDLLVELCDTLRERLALCNIFPAQWHGPGAVASAVLRTNHIGAAKGVYDDVFRLQAESAYYGGRFEQFKRGSYFGTVYQYDIRSAYPAAMTHLPDLSAVTWEHRRQWAKYDVHNDYALYHVVCHRDEEAKHIGRLPHRNTLGTIYFPPWANGWYWGIECRHIPAEFRQDHWMPYGAGLKLRPFAFVAEQYRQRAILKKANQPQQLALKLALNSLYGKLAQSKGAEYTVHGWKYPTFHETVWAGWITAYTRQMINEAMHTVDPKYIIATETDSIFTWTPLDVPLSEALGDWELTLADGIRYIQSGVSLVLTGGEWHFKTRGFTVKPSVSEVDVWTKFIVEGKPITVRQTRFGTDVRQRKFGEWYTMDRTLSLDGSAMEKRTHDTKHCAACGGGVGFGNVLHPMTAQPIPFQPSEPYRFAWREALPLVELAAELFSFTDDPITEMEYITS